MTFSHIWEHFPVGCGFLETRLTLQPFPFYGASLDSQMHTFCMAMDGAYQSAYKWSHLPQPAPAFPELQLPWVPKGNRFLWDFPPFPHLVGSEASQWSLDTSLTPKIMKTTSLLGRI